MQVIAGNVATAEGAKALIDAGADAVKVGIGPGSICTTRIVAGVGVPQLTAIMDAVEAARKPACRSSPTAASSIRATSPRRSPPAPPARMIGSLLAGTDETPGEVFLYQGRSYKSLSRHGLGRRDGARLGRPLFPAGHQGHLKLVPEGIEGQVPYKGPAASVLHQLAGGLRAAMGYVGATISPNCTRRRSSCASPAPACAKAMSTT